MQPAAARRRHVVQRARARLLGFAVLGAFLVDGACGNLFREVFALATFEQAVLDVLVLAFAFGVPGISRHRATPDLSAVGRQSAAAACPAAHAPAPGSPWAWGRRFRALAARASAAARPAVGSPAAAPAAWCGRSSSNSFGWSSGRQAAGPRPGSGSAIAEMAVMGRGSRRHLRPRNFP